MSQWIYKVMFPSLSFDFDLWYIWTYSTSESYWTNLMGSICENTTIICIENSVVANLLVNLFVPKTKIQYYYEVKKYKEFTNYRY